jgi:5S rRNA maturation endonuclease (ribonuclease M5)
VRDVRVDRVLDRLRGVRRNADGWSALCPAHDDRNPSLSVGVGGEDRVLLHCHAGCEYTAIIEMLGLSPADLAPRAASHSPVSAPIIKPEITVEYHYTDELGASLFQVVRYDDKTFKQRRRDGAGWTWRLNGVRRVIYRLPEAIQAVAEERTIYVVEGEKDVEALARVGLTATTNPGGAGKWREEFSESIAGANVVILPDNDDSGRAHALQVAESLRGHGCAVRVVALPGLPEKGDVSDFLRTHTVAELLALVEPPPNPSVTGQTGALADVVDQFTKWLHLPDLLPLYAVLGAIAANYLPGDPVWLGLVAPPSSAKTEILNATSRLPDFHPASTITPGSLLSGTSKRERSAHAKGGLLKAIGSFGFLVLKDFTSILSMRPDAKAEILAALREIYDGSWVRNVGTDGGQTLSWSGKIGVLFGVTPAIDSHHSVIGAMGERFLLCRLPPAGACQAEYALKHVGQATTTMRTALADAVAALFASPRRDPRPLSDVETKRLTNVASLAVRLRSTVERDRFSREIEAVQGAEGPARLVLALERLLAGLDSIGCDRARALDVVERVALDSVPPLRRRAYQVVREHAGMIETKAVADALRLPTNTIRRVLEELAVYDLVRREGHGQGQADLWGLGDVA